MKCECQGCAERTPYCHATCQAYAKYRAKVARVRYLNKKRRENDVLPSDR